MQITFHLHRWLNQIRTHPTETSSIVCKQVGDGLLSLAQPKSPEPNNTM